MTITEHFKTQRADRYAFIATTVGIGTVIHSYQQPYTKHTSQRPCVVHITTTGIAIVKTPDDVLVTMYVLTLKEAEKYFTTIPYVLAAVIKQNMKRKYHLLQNTIQY